MQGTTVLFSIFKVGPFGRLSDTFLIEFHNEIVDMSPGQSRKNFVIYQ